jgi:hypothetical protein
MQWAARHAWGVAAALALGSLALSPAAAAPTIGAQATRVDIGELLAGETVEAEFTLSNTGTELLKIDKVIVSCGCVTTSFPEMLKPGEKGALKVKLASNALWKGPIEKQITVLSNDPLHTGFNLTLVARVRSLFQFSPENPMTVNYKKGEMIRQVFQITSAGDATVAITGVMPGGPGVEARILPREPSDTPGLTRVEVIAHSPERGGDFTSQAILQTEHPKVTSIPLVINGVSDDVIKVIPALTYLGTLAEKPGPEPFQRIVTIYKRVGNFRVLEIKSDNPAIKGEVMEAITGNIYQIAIKYVGSSQKGELKGKLTIVTDNPDAPKVELSYVGMVQ